MQTLYNRARNEWKNATPCRKRLIAILSNDNNDLVVAQDPIPLEHCKKALFTDSLTPEQAKEHSKKIIDKIHTRNNKLITCVEQYYPNVIPSMRGHKLCRLHVTLPSFASSGFTTNDPQLLSLASAKLTLQEALAARILGSYITLRKQGLDVDDSIDFAQTLLNFDSNVEFTPFQSFDPTTQKVIAPVADCTPITTNTRPPPKSLHEIFSIETAYDESENISLFHPSECDYIENVPTIKLHNYRDKPIDLFFFEFKDLLRSAFSVTVVHRGENREVFTRFHNRLKAMKKPTKIEKTDPLQLFVRVYPKRPNPRLQFRTLQDFVSIAQELNLNFQQFCIMDYIKSNPVNLTLLEQAYHLVNPDIQDTLEEAHNNSNKAAFDSLLAEFAGLGQVDVCVGDPRSPAQTRSIPLKLDTHNNEWYFEENDIYKALSDGPHDRLKHWTTVCLSSYPLFTFRKTSLIERICVKTSENQFHPLHIYARILPQALGWANLNPRTKTTAFSAFGKQPPSIDLLKSAIDAAANGDHNLPLQYLDLKSEFRRFECITVQNKHAISYFNLWDYLKTILRLETRTDAVKFLQSLDNSEDLYLHETMHNILVPQDSADLYRFSLRKRRRREDGTYAAHAFDKQTPYKLSNFSVLINLNQAMAIVQALPESKLCIQSPIIEFCCKDILQ